MKKTGFFTALVMFTSSTAALTALPAVINKFHPRRRAVAGDNDHSQSIQKGGRDEL